MSTTQDPSTEADRMLSTHDKKEALIRKAQRWDVIANEDPVEHERTALEVSARERAFKARKLARKL